MSLVHIVVVCVLALYLILESSVWACTPAPGTVTIASFNIKWVGYYDKERDDEGLVDLVKACDVVVIQELVAPPDFTKVGMPVNWPEDRGMRYPNGDPLRFDDGATQFFSAMRKVGFDKFMLSEEDTGPGDRNHKNSAATEWFVAFYKSARLKSRGGPDTKCLPSSGFIANDLTANADYERVPFAFWFKTKSGTEMDFVLVSVHLQPDAGRKPRARRKQELGAIARYIEREAHGQGKEKDWFILGDMNIQSCKELAEVLPARFKSLNDECRDTVPSVMNRPYDHVMYRPDLTQAVDSHYDMVVIDLVQSVRHRWSVVGDGPYPGEPYKSRIFPKYFSDHNPINFRIKDSPDVD